MKDIATLEELREIRRKLSLECGEDPERYAAMLAQVAQNFPGVYVDSPLLPEVSHSKSNVS